MDETLIQFLSISQSEGVSYICRPDVYVRVRGQGQLRLSSPDLLLRTYRTVERARIERLSIYCTLMRMTPVI